MDKADDWESWFLKYRKEFGCENINSVYKVCSCNVCCSLAKAWDDADAAFVAYEENLRRNIKNMVPNG